MNNDLSNDFNIYFYEDETSTSTSSLDDEQKDPPAVEVAAVAAVPAVEVAEVPAMAVPAVAPVTAVRVVPSRVCDNGGNMMNKEAKQRQIINFTVQSNTILLTLLMTPIPVTAPVLAPHKWLLALVKRFQGQVCASRQIIQTSRSKSEATLQLNKLNAFGVGSLRLLKSQYLVIAKWDTVLRSLNNSLHPHATPTDLQNYALLKKRMIHLSHNQWNDTYKLCIAFLK